MSIANPASTAEQITKNVGRFDGAIENAITGDGDPSYDKTTHNRPGEVTRLSYQQKEDLYEGSWLCRRICDAYPSEGTREWTEVALGSDGKQKLLGDFQTYEERLAPAEAFNQAQTWANIYRGAAIVLHVDDGRSSDQPINREKIRSIIDIDVLDPLDIRPNITASFNPLKPDYYELVGVKTSRIEQNKLAGMGLPQFHPDRVIRFDGFALPARSMRRNENWGGSILDNIWTSYSRYESGNNAIAAMLTDFNVFVYALKGLGNLIASSDDKSLLELKNRLRSLRLTMSNLKGLVIDADGEKADFVSRNLSGVSDVIEHLKGDLIGASGLPHTAVFGESPSGLGATGDSEADTWAKMVNQFQEKSFRKKVKQLYELIWLAKDGPSNGKIPDDWRFKFKPLVQESEETKIANRSAQATTDNTYVSMGVLLKDEVRQSRFGGSEFSFETTLDTAAWKKAQEADQFDMSQFDVGGDPNADPNAPPDGTDPNAPPDDGGGDPAAAPAPDAAPETAPAAKKQKVKADSAEPRKRVNTIAGLNLDITHDPGDDRHGRTMTMGYGRIRGSYGHAEDKMAWDVFVGPNPDSNKVFKIRQLDPDTLFHDETKYVVGCDTIEQARDLGLIQMGADRFGGIEPVKHSELSSYRKDCSEDCGCAVKQKPNHDLEAGPDLTKAALKKESPVGSSRSRSKNTRKSNKRTEVLDEESDRETYDGRRPQHKAGHYWVKDPSVKGGGYWRKNALLGTVNSPKNAHANQPTNGAEFKEKWFPGSQFKGNFYFSKSRREKMKADAERLTGLKVHELEAYKVEDPTLSVTLKSLIDAHQEGSIPEDVTHFVTSHGAGKGEDWHFEAIKGYPGPNIHQWVNENIPKGEKAIVHACEEGHERMHYEIKNGQNRIVLESQGKASKQDSISQNPAILERTDSRRIWVNDPGDKGGGYWRTDPRSRHEPSHAKQFVPKAEFGKLTLSPGFRPIEDGVHSTMFVQSPEGEEYLYKVARHNDLDSAAAEILCSELAASVGVKANTTRLVPIALSSEFKDAGGSAGTLHSLVPGEPLVQYARKNPEALYTDVKMRLSDYYGEEVEDAIRGMVKHPDLARMTALDVFTGNNDRHRGNFFYDPQQNHFHAIDMGSAFSIQPSTLFAKSAKLMQEELKALPPDQQNNLRIFTSTLQQLQAKNHPLALQSRLTNLTTAASSKAGFEASMNAHEKDFKKYAKLYTTNMAQAQAHLKKMQEQASSERAKLQFKTQKSLYARLQVIQQNSKEVPKVLSALKRWQ